MLYIGPKGNSAERSSIVVFFFAFTIFIYGKRCKRVRVRGAYAQKRTEKERQRLPPKEGGKLTRIQVIYAVGIYVQLV